MTGRVGRPVAGVAALAALALGGAALANAGTGGDVPADTAAKLRDAAVAAVPGKPGSIERDGDHGATYEVEVVRADGTQIDVALDERMRVVGVDDDGETQAADRADDAGEADDANEADDADDANEADEADDANESDGNEADD
jgi:hypothetical protein